MRHVVREDVACPTPSEGVRACRFIGYFREKYQITNPKLQINLKFQKSKLMYKVTPVLARVLRLSLEFAAIKLDSLMSVCHNIR